MNLDPTFVKFEDEDEMVLEIEHYNDLKQQQGYETTWSLGSGMMTLDQKIFSNKPRLVTYKVISELGETFEDTKYDEPRIIIPLYYKKNLIGIQGRSMDFGNPKSVKYITVMINDNAPKIYGLDDVELDGPVYVTEGPFDSLFLSNAIAMCGSDVTLDDAQFTNLVYVLDNEPRNYEIVKKYEKLIQSGKQIVIWPNTIKEKDLNDMIMSGHNVQRVVDSNIYSGLEATIKLNAWKKV